MAQQQEQQQSFREYRVRMCRTEPKKYHVMRFKPPHKCDLEKLHHPTLERQKVASKSEQELPETGEGSEYGQKWREEARQRRRGYGSRKKEPDDQPWVLKEKKKGGKHFVSRKEGSVNASSSYYLLTFCEDGVFEALPVSSWYDFVPPVKYDYLNAEEAEKKFEQRHKTLNYFSVMLSCKLREEEEGEGGEGGEGKIVSKTKAAGDLYLTDSESNKSYSSDEEEGGASRSGKKGKLTKKSRRRGGKKKGEGGEDEEAGEETDEGDMEGQEVDYMSRSSSESEEEFQAKKAIKEVPKDDEEVDRQEEGEIDRGFTESSSSSEDELTEAGKEIQALMKKQTGPGGEELSDEEEVMEQDTAKPPSQSSFSTASTSTSSPAKTLAPPSSSSRPTTPTKSQSKGKGEASSKKDKKKVSGSSTPQKRPLEQPPASETGSSTSGTPPSKKPKGVESTSTITEEEVRRYLMRKPITSKELLKKFKSKKPDIDKTLVPEMLSRIIKKMPNVEEKRIDGKFYLSLKATTMSE